MSDEYGTRDDRFLNGGVFASHDGERVWLDMRDDPKGSGEGWKRIPLDVQARRALISFFEEMKLRGLQT